MAYYDEGAGMWIDESTGQGTNQVGGADSYVDTNDYSYSPSNTAGTGASSPQDWAASVDQFNAIPGASTQPPSTFDSVIASLLQPDNLKTVLGATIMGSANGISAWLNGRTQSKNYKEALQTKYDREDQTIRDKVTRASVMPTLKRVTKDNQGKKVGEGWKAPGLIASSRSPA